MKEKHNEKRAVSCVSWGLAVYCAFYGVKTIHFFVLFSVHCERLQSLSNDKCFMYPDKVKYILV